MVDSTVVEVALGLAVIFLLVATVAAGINQVFSRLFDVRAKMLWAAIHRLLHAPDDEPPDLGGLAVVRATAFNAGERRPKRGEAGVLDALAATPALRALDPVMSPGAHTKIDAIPAKLFATALLELSEQAVPAAGASTASGVDQSAELPDRIAWLIARDPASPLASFLRTSGSAISHDADAFLSLTGEWFDAQMTRVTFLYRRSARWVLLGIGALAAVALNVDAIEIGTALRTQPDTRAAVVLLADDLDAAGAAGCAAPPAPPTGAQSAAPDPPADGAVAAGNSPRAMSADLDCVRTAIGRLNGLKLPVLGEWNPDTWRSSWAGGWARVVGHVIGLALTAGAVALGAPFWFDAVKWLSGVRRSTRP